MVRCGKLGAHGPNLGTVRHPPYKTVSHSAQMRPHDPLTSYLALAAISVDSENKRGVGET